MSDQIFNSVSVLPANSAFSMLRDDFDFENLNVSFNGCGFLGIYHVGVACALQYYLPNMRFKNICGASAGAMAAVCLIAGVPLGKNFSTHLLSRRFYFLLSLKGAEHVTCLFEICIEASKSLVHIELFSNS